MTGQDPRSLPLAEDTPHEGVPDRSARGSDPFLPLIATGIALFLAYAVLVLGGILPFALLNPAWQLRLAGVLVSSAYLPLLGLCLLHLSKLVSEVTRQPQRRLLDLYTRVRRVAVLATLGFLLLLPLQAGAAWQLIQKGFRGMDGAGPASTQPRLDAMEKAIREAPDARSIQNSLTILRGPAIAPQDMQRPLPQLKQLLLQSLERARQSLTNDSRRETSTRVWMLIQECIRNSAIALAYALGFAAFAQRPQEERTLLQECIGLVRPSERDQYLRRLRQIRRQESESERRRLQDLERFGRDQQKRHRQELQRRQREEQR